MSEKKVAVVGSSEITGLLSARMMLCDIGRQDLLSELYILEKNSFLFYIPTYKDETLQSLKNIQSETEIVLTVDYEDESIENNSVAYHRMKGTIRAESNYWYSSKQYVADLLAAEANPRIIAHLTHTNSGGGDAWYNDVVAEVVKNLQKPLINIIERVEASAALFQNAYAKKRYVVTEFDTIGSIGTMMSYLDLIPYFEKMGAKYHEEYASASTEKNKRIRLLREGKPERFIKEELDPLRDNFAKTMRNAIPSLGTLAEDHKIIQGTTVYSNEAIELGLVDGIRTIAQAVQEAYDMGIKLRSEREQNSFFQNKAINILNS